MSDSALLLGPAPGVDAERGRFADLQTMLRTELAPIHGDPAAARTVVVLPSLSMDPDVLATVTGVHHYEERMLCLLLLLNMPRTEVVYLSSVPVPDPIVDYYLHLLPGIPERHARRRLTMLSCDDRSRVSLTRKVLDRPRLIERIRRAIGGSGSAHLSCFNVTCLERQLALELGIPIYGCDPDLLSFGSKSGSRRIFREAGVDLPFGFEDLTSLDDVTDALAETKRARPALERAVVKLNEGFSGEGNAVFDLRGAPTGSTLRGWVRERLTTLAFEGRGVTLDLFAGKLAAMGGVVEEWIPGVAESPSVQFTVDPGGTLVPISTHDQVLGGASGQIFLGARFPAASAYRLAVQEEGLRAARALAAKGVVGRFGIDFVSVRHGDGWRHLAIEINLRRGGTTHTFDTLRLLTGGRYDPGSGRFLTPAGRPRFYYATDNLESERYRGLTADDLIDIAALNGLHFNAADAEGVVFHLIGALSEFGKLGLVAIGSTRARADELYRRTVAVLDLEGAAGQTSAG